MKTQTKTILTVVKFLALLGAIGFSIECGSQIISFIVSFYNPEVATKFYKVNPRLFELYNLKLGYFIGVMSFTIFFSGMKAFIWYYMFDFLLKLKLKNPFTNEISVKIQKTSYLLFDIWVVAIIGDNYLKFVSKNSMIDLVNNFNYEEYFFMAGIVYIISQIFKRGVELQEENELTV